MIISHMLDRTGSELRLHSFSRGFLLELHGYRDEDGGDATVTFVLEEAEADRLAERIQIVLEDHATYE